MIAPSQTAAPRRAPPFSLRGLDPRALLIFAVLVLYVLWPILQVLGESVYARGEGLTMQPWRDFIAEGHHVYAGRSLLVSGASVILAGVFGTALAFLYFRLDFPGRTIFAGLTLLPFTLPPLVGVFAIWTLMGESGLFHKVTKLATEEGFWFEKGFGGVLLVHTYSMFVYFYVLVGGAVASMDESQVEAARDLGAGKLTTLLRVVLPQLAPAFAGASLLVFMTSMASFTAPFFYTAGRPVLTVGIQQALEENETGLASADCVVLAICAAVFLFLVLRFETAIQGGTKGATRRRAKISSPLLRWSLSLFALMLTLVLVLPHISMLYESLVKPGTGFIGVPVEYTLRNYSSIWEVEDAWRPFANSLKSSAMATLAVIIVALTSSWLVIRRDFRGKPLMRLLVMIPFAQPGTVIGIGLLWITRQPNLLTFGAAWRGTLIILAVAYFIRMLPLAYRTIATGLARVPLELEGAARDLGASPRQAFIRITLPLLLPSIIAAATLTFATAMGEFVSSILLYGPGTEPVSVKIDQLRRGPGGIHLAAAYSTILMAMITLTFVLFGRRSRGVE